MRPFIILVIITCLSYVSEAQQQAIVYYEPVVGDSMRLFFDSSYVFTEQNCTKYIRSIRMDTQGEFNGHFEDRDNKNNLLGTGTYIHGVKQGLFEVYNNNGTIRANGRYENNVPTGTWHFFYDNGKPERTIESGIKDTSIVDFFDKQGVQTVKDGQGAFSGEISAFDNPVNHRYPDNPFSSQGKIINGKPDGLWLGRYKRDIFCKEKYEKGQWIGSVFEHKTYAKNGAFLKKPYLNSFFPRLYFDHLEAFLIEECKKLDTISNTNYVFNVNRFESDLRRKIDRIIEQDFMTKNTWSYNVGDNDILIQFTLDDKGKAENLRLLSSFGYHFFPVISNVIRDQQFQEKNKLLHFSLRLHFAGVFSYQYRFRFY